MRKKMMGGGMMQRPMYKKGGVSVGPKKRSEHMKKLKNKLEKKAKDRMGLKMGGSLKSVPAGNKGLKKLPTEVRNKMGFMKKGGVVSDTKKKQFKANKAGQKSFNKKAMKVAKTIGKIVIPGAAATDAGVKLARKFKGTK